MRSANQAAKGVTVGGARIVKWFAGKLSTSTGPNVHCAQSKRGSGFVPGNVSSAHATYSAPRPKDVYALNRERCRS